MKKENLVEHFQEFVRGKERTEISNRIKSKQEIIRKEREEKKLQDDINMVEPKRKKQEQSL